jgi:crotonobetainyl-CoA:carnitine CoA-transferase CaiB-like acyl-CoA transferase
MAPQAPPASALAGLRIADLTIITAGASATQILADLGAEVIKVEATGHPDPFRNWAALAPPDLAEPWNASPTFNAVNRNKRGITLDLKHPLGRAAFLKLVSVSDVVVENFRRGVMDRLGLSYAALCQVRPNMLMVSLSSQGATGPEAGYGSFGSTLDALSGLMSITGYGPDAPIWSSNEVNYPDQVVSMFGAAAMLMGLRHRRRTGQGMYIDVSQRELATSMLGEVVLDYTVNGRVAQPRANRDPAMVPHGVYRCRGEDAWLAIAVRDDAEWAALCRVIERPELAEDERYTTLSGRQQHQSELQMMVAAWAAGHDKRAAMDALQRAGVPAAAVLDGRELLEDPHLAARGFYRTVDHPIGGRQRQRTWPFRLSRTPAEIRSPAPSLGEHNTQVLAGLLDYTDTEIQALNDAGVIGTVPGIGTAASV